MVKLTLKTTFAVLPWHTPTTSSPSLKLLQLAQMLQKMWYWWEIHGVSHNTMVHGHSTTQDGTQTPWRKFRWVSTQPRTTCVVSSWLPFRTCSKLAALMRWQLLEISQPWVTSKHGMTLRTRKLAKCMPSIYSCLRKEAISTSQLNPTRWKQFLLNALRIIWKLNRLMERQLRFRWNTQLSILLCMIQTTTQNPFQNFTIMILSREEY